MEDWTLEEERLSELLLLAQPFPLEESAARDLARHWVGVSALAWRAARRANLTGDETFRESMWLELREALLEEEREERLGSAVPEPDEEEFRRGRYVLLAHVLRRVGPETSEAERDLQRRTAERILADLREGGSWEAAVAESEDPATRRLSGLLGIFERGELPPPLDRTAFRLEPGQVSSVLRSAQGFHILYRPRYDEVSDLFAERVRERLLAEADGAPVRGLLDRRGFRLDPGAVALLRSAAESPLPWLDSDETVAVWDDGELQAAAVARYVTALPAASREEMGRAAERHLVSFLEDVGRREIRVADARARGLTVDEEIVSRLRELHAEELRGWLETLGISPGEPDPRPAIDRYMERAVSRRLDVRSMPPLFEAWLLDGLEWTVAERGVSASVARARTMIEAAGTGADPGDPAPADPPGRPEAR